MTTNDWWQLISDNPEDELTWHAFFDWLQDEGLTEHLDTARLIFTRKYRPAAETFSHYVPRQDRNLTPSWDWRIDTIDLDIQDILLQEELAYRRSSFVPRRVYELLKTQKLAPEPYEHSFKEYASPVEAYVELAKAMILWGRENDEEGLVKRAGETVEGDKEQG